MTIDILRQWRLGRLMVAALAVAAIGAGCGQSPPGDDGQTATTAATTTSSSTEQPATYTAIDRGELDTSEGPGSLALAAAEALFDAEELGGEWRSFEQLLPNMSACDFLDGQAELRTDYLNVETNDSIGVGIIVYPDEAAAEQALAAAAGPEYDACAEEGLTFMAAQAAEAGVWDITSDGAAGAVQEASFLPDEDSHTRRNELSAVGGGSSWELDVASTAFRQGRSIVVIDVALADGDLAQLTNEVRDLLGDIPSDPIQEPALDTAVDRLRRAVVGPDAPAEFFTVFEAASVRPPSELPCDEFAQAQAQLAGPVWLTSNQVSALIQRGWTFDDEATATAALAAVETTDLDCLAAVFVDSLLGEVEVTGTEFAWVDDEGWPVATIELTMIRRLGEPEPIEADWTVRFAFTRRGAEIVGWEFIGLTGDDPDLVALTAKAAANMEDNP